MSIPKVVGIETEYGIMVWGAETFSPFLTSQLVLNAYQSTGGPAVPTGVYYNVQTGDVEDDFEEEKTKANGKAATAQHLLYGLGSLMLSNGARFYIDHAHPEYCTPETLSPRGVVAADKAGERIVARCCAAVNENKLLPEGQQVLIYKNNSDAKGNSYGCHENYLLSMDLFEDLLRRRSHLVHRYLLPFLVTRSVMCGAGKVGYENHSSPALFQLAQRADFFETLTGLQTTYQRPLFNLRDESHADQHTFRRLHVILGDANLAEISTYLKVGTTQLVLLMLEDGFLKTDLTLTHPLDAFRQVSRDLTFRQPLRLEDGRQLTAVEIQECYLEWAEDYLDEHDGTDEQWEVWDRWAEVIDTLKTGQVDRLGRQLDWAIKKTVLERYLAGQATSWQTAEQWQGIIDHVLTTGDLSTAESFARRAGLEWGDYARQREIYFTLRRLDLEYHDIRPQAGLFYRLQNSSLVERLISDGEIDALIGAPPPDTRAWLRGKLVERFARHITGADWSYVQLKHPDKKSDLAYRLEFPNPLIGSEHDLAPVWDTFRTPEQMFAYFWRTP